MWDSWSSQQTLVTFWIHYSPVSFLFNLDCLICHMIKQIKWHFLTNNNTTFTTYSFNSGKNKQVLDRYLVTQIWKISSIYLYIFVFLNPNVICYWPVQIYIWEISWVSNFITNFHIFYESVLQWNMCQLHFQHVLCS